MDPALYFEAMEARLTAGVSERMVALAGVDGGERALDVACGRGEPAWRLARAVGPAGHVVGVDLAADRLKAAREIAAGRGLGNVSWVQLDAERVDSLGTFDVATCRWGVMYVPSPERALAAISRALRPGGRFVAALWAEPDRVAWATFPRRVIGRFAPMSPVDPERPGAFRFSRLDQIERDFGAAGLRVEHVEEHDVAVVEGQTGAEIARWVEVVLGRWLDAVPDRAEGVAALADEAERYRTDGGIRVGGVTRLVVARRPE